MKIYLAARYSRRLELCDYRIRLQQQGHTVTSRWLNGAHQIDRDGMKLGALGEEYVEAGSDEHAAQLRRHFASEDMSDVFAADLMIAFTEEPRAEASRGGRHVELGLALATGKTIYLVGPRENVFCWLPGIRQFSNIEACYSHMRERKENDG